MPLDYKVNKSALLARLVDLIKPYRQSCVREVDATPFSVLMSFSVFSYSQGEAQGGRDEVNGASRGLGTLCSSCRSIHDVPHVAHQPNGFLDVTDS